MYINLSNLAVAASILASPCFVSALSAEDIPSDLPVSTLLTSAQTHLSRGQTSDALVYYDAAIARDPSNYLTLFKRATTYLSLGRTTQATDDFNKVLALKPGFEGAHVQLAKIKSRSADWQGAKEQFTMANKDASSTEMAEILEAERAADLADAAEKAGDFEACISHAGDAIMTASRALHLRELRSRCRFARGEVEEGMSDLHHVLQMRPGDTTPHVVISATTFYGLGDLENGMSQIRKCLHSDPDSKSCAKLLKQEKAISKVLGKAQKALDKKQPVTGVKMLVDNGEEKGVISDIKTQFEELKAAGSIPPQASSALYTRVIEMACEGYYEMNGKKTKQYCEEALSLDASSFFGLLYRGKSEMEREEFEDAVRTFEEASKLRPDKQDLAREQLNKAKVALKRSKTKDYYKVLGVAHDSDERQIKSAYRKLTKVHHPDKAAKQGLSKEAAEKKMAAINEAYEVLSDPELRARFDRGDDPNDQESGRGHPGGHYGGGSPFMFHQGGGGSQQFKFQFGGQGGGFGGFPF